MTITPIATEADISRGVAALEARCEVMRRTIVPLCGMPPLRRSRAGFDGLAWIIVGQQLSVASANAIWARVEVTFPVRTPKVFLSADETTLRSAGLSAPKIKALRAISTAIDDGTLDLDALGDMDADAAKERLVVVKGIGPWTADIYLMFCLGHPDAFAPGDLALQEAIRIAFRLDERPTIRETGQIAERWRPDRAVAARLLWAYYKLAKSREGVGAA
jgi:DNA-3-methyladenine glycosylase II